MRSNGSSLKSDWSYRNIISSHFSTGPGKTCPCSHLSCNQIKTRFLNLLKYYCELSMAPCCKVIEVEIEDQPGRYLLPPLKSECPRSGTETEWPRRIGIGIYIDIVLFGGDEGATSSCCAMSKCEFAALAKCTALQSRLQSNACCQLRV